MTEPKETSPQEEPQAEAAESAEAAAPETLLEDDDADSPLVDGEIPQVAVDDELARLEAEIASLKDQLLRALAETENVRRRTQRERADAARFAVAPLAKDILGVADNLGLALASLPEEVANDERVRPLVDGIKLTEKELQTAFERHQISKIAPLGERLDPHLHEAMFEVEDPSQPAGTVVQLLQPGYRLHERLLRPARVGVAKGGSKGANDNGQKPGSQVDTTA